MKHINLTPTLPEVLGSIARATTSSVGRASASLQVELADDAADGESIIPTEDVTERVSEVGQQILEAEAEIEAAVAAVEAAQAELAATKTVFESRFADQDAALALADGRYTVAEVDPDASDAVGKPVGAVWEVRAGGIVERRYILTGEASWTQVKAASGVLAVDEVAAAVGVFIDAMMNNLSVTGVANIKQVVTNELWAKLAVVDRLQALTEIITQDMIATGAVTADKVVASQALIDKLITPDLMAGKIRTSMFRLGDNWRWTEDVFGAYLPVVGDQSVTDWASRVPAFEITPSGDATYTVYQEGKPTAGMQPDGTVWGTTGDFNDLSVGGKPLGEVMSPYPQGMIYATALQQDVGLGVTTETRLLNAQVRMYPSRTYRVVMQVAYIDTGRVNLRVRQSASGVPVVGNSLQTEVGRDGTAGGRGLIHYDYILRSDDLSDTIPEDGLIVNIGMFVTMSGWAPATVYGAYPVSGAPGKPRTMLTVEDMGASLDMDWVTVANNVPAPAPSVSTYSKTATYKGGWGWRGVAANGAIQPNNRATVGGSIYGSAMNNLIVVGVSNMTTNLSGATVTKATVTVKRAAGGTAATVYWNIGFSSNSSAPTSGPAVTNIATNAAFTVGQTRTFTLTAAQANNLRTGAFRSVVVSPTNSGNANSYGYLDVAATKVDYSYKK